jgi:hypothetical protein
MIDTLAPADQFAVIAFSDAMEGPRGTSPGTLVQASDRRRFAAIEFLAQLQAVGGTEIAAPLQRAVNILGSSAPPGAARERVAVLVTDGQVANEDQVLRQLGARLKDVRVFALGIDREVNAGFLQKLATLGGGYAEVVESEDRLDAVLEGIHRRIGTPLLTSVHLDFPECGIEADSQTPRRLPDLFAGAPLVVRTRYCGDAPITARVSATDSAGAAWTETVASTSGESPAIRSLWARDQIRALEDEYAIGRGDQQALAARIVECSLRHKVLSRFTAFVAVDRSEVANAGGEGQRIIQPVEAADGWDMLTDDVNDIVSYSRCMPPGFGGASCGGVEMAGSPPASHHVAGLFRFDISEEAPGYVSGGTPAARKLRQTSRPQAGPGFNPTVFRDRARQMLHDLRQMLPGTNALHVLAMFFAQSTALLEELDAAGAPEGECRALREFLDALHRRFDVGIDEQQAGALWAEAETLLEGFARGAPPPAGERLASAGTPQREGFWK